MDDRRPPRPLAIPRLEVPRFILAPDEWPSELAWARVPAVPLVRSDGSGAPEQATGLRVLTSGRSFWVRFDCSDRDAWGTHTERDAPLWEEETVEVFLALPEGPFPRRYVEIEVSPTGALFDAVVDSPTGDRREMTVDTGWDLAGLEVRIDRIDHTGSADDWRATLRVPWSGLLEALETPALETSDSPSPTSPPRLLRANFYRIERPRGGGGPEFSAWSPTLAKPPDFHRPERFGWLVLGSGH